jgi:hypothetical protein
MHLVSRAVGESEDGLVLKVLDLGVMIAAEEGQEKNSNSAVQAFRRRGATEEKRRRYDWLPWEIRDGNEVKGPSVNFCRPPYSFDVFSLGVLILHLLVGKTEARCILDTVHDMDARVANPAPLGVDTRLLLRMLSVRASERPHPAEVLEVLERRGFLSKRIPLLPDETWWHPAVPSDATETLQQPPEESVAAPAAMPPPASAPLSAPAQAAAQAPAHAVADDDEEEVPTVLSSDSSEDQPVGVKAPVAAPAATALAPALSGLSCDTVATDEPLPDEASAAPPRIGNKKTQRTHLVTWRGRDFS